MAKAVAHILTVDSPLCELVRFAIVTSCPLALVFAGRVLPF